MKLLNAFFLCSIFVFNPVFGDDLPLRRNVTIPVGLYEVVEDCLLDVVNPETDCKLEKVYKFAKGLYRVENSCNLNEIGVENTFEPDEKSLTAEHFHYEFKGVYKSHVVCDFSPALCGESYVKYSFMESFRSPTRCVIKAVRYD